MLKRNSTVPRDMPLISVGYNYNPQGFLYFVATYDSGRTKSSIPYLYNYNELFDNFFIFPVDYPLFVSKLFGYVNDIYSHKNIHTVSFRAEKVLGYSMSLATVSCYGNYHCQFLETILLLG